MRINPPEAHKLVRIRTAEGKHAPVVGGRTIGRFAVAPGDDAKFNAQTVELFHNLIQRLWLPGVKTDSLAGGPEHVAVSDAVYDLRRVGPEPEVNDIHGAYPFFMALS